MKNVELMKSLRSTVFIVGPNNFRFIIKKISNTQYWPTLKLIEYRNSSFGNRHSPFRKFDTSHYSFAISQFRKVVLGKLNRIVQGQSHLVVADGFFFFTHLSVIGGDIGIVDGR